MTFYKVTYKYKFDDGRYVFERIGIYSSAENAKKAIEWLETQDKYKGTADGFRVRRLFRLFKPRFLNETLPTDGSGRRNELCWDKEAPLIQHFGFLLTVYGFRFHKEDLGDMVDEDGKMLFYGPYNHYCFYNEKVCIHFLHLVQRQDWYIYITREFISDQNLIEKGIAVPGELCYNMPLLASRLREELSEKRSVFGICID